MFEREVVHRFRAAGIQAERGYHQARSGAEAPDVVVPGLWVECGCGASVQPEKKLAQAVRDERVLFEKAHGMGGKVYPVAVTRRLGSRELVATMMGSHLFEMMSAVLHGGWTNLLFVAPVVSMQLDSFLVLIAKPWLDWRNKP